MYPRRSKLCNPGIQMSHKTTWVHRSGMDSQDPSRVASLHGSDYMGFNYTHLDSKCSFTRRFIEKATREDGRGLGKQRLGEAKHNR